MRSNPTCQHTPTRGYQGTVLIHGSLGTGAFSNSPALYQQFNVPPDPLGSTSPCLGHGIGDPIVAPVGDSCFATSRGSPTLVIPAASCCQCISAQIEHNSDRCHGEIYFDNVIVYCHKTRKKKDPHPQQKTKNITEETGAGGSHPARSSRYTVRQASHGSPMLAFFLNKKESMDNVYGYCQSPVVPTLVISATIALLKPSLWYFCLCGTSWGPNLLDEAAMKHVISYIRIYHLVKHVCLLAFKYHRNFRDESVPIFH